MRECVRLGAKAVVNGRRSDRVAALAKELGGEQTVRGVVGDCADEGVIQQLLHAAHQLGGADLVVVNAGRGLKGGAMDSDTAQWEEMIRTNILGAARLLRACGSVLAKQSEGLQGAAVLHKARDLIVIGSVVGRHVSPFSAMYGSTKFAVHGLTEATRRELGPKGVRVSLIEPGFVVSEFQGVAGYADEWFAQVVEKIGPPLTPADVARTIAFVASQPAGVHISDVMIRPTRQDYP